MEDQDSGTRGQDNEEIETQQITPETQHEIRPRPAQQTTPEAPKEIDIYTILQQMSKQLQEQRSEQSQQSKQMQRQISQMSQQIIQQNQILRDKLATQLNEFKKENHEIIQQFRVETKTMINEEINSINVEINNKFSDTEKQIKEIDDKHSNDIKIINKKLIATNKHCDESFAAHKLEAEKLRELENKIDNNSGETNLNLQQLQSDIRTKIALATASPINRSIANEQIKEIQFNATSNFPVEFIKELTELYQEYYQDINNITWVSRRLEGEATIWWRLVRDSINTFVEFTEAFVNKYWNDVIQERVRDQLEFGWYHQEAGMSMIQYLERKLLENRQLIPPISDRHLIRKIARHYPHEIEVTIITRGVSTIVEFEQVLLEFSSLRNGNRSVNQGQLNHRPEHKQWKRADEERERERESY